MLFCRDKKEDWKPWGIFRTISDVASCQCKSRWLQTEGVFDTNLFSCHLLQNNKCGWACESLWILWAADVSATAFREDTLSEDASALMRFISFLPHQIGNSTQRDAVVFRCSGIYASSFSTLEPRNDLVRLFLKGCSGFHTSNAVYITDGSLQNIIVLLEVMFVAISIICVNYKQKWAQKLFLSYARGDRNETRSWAINSNFLGAISLEHLYPHKII